MARLRFNFITGDVDDDPLTNSATTLTSSDLSALGVVEAPDIAVIILDPKGTAGAPEVVHVTAHEASATTATILRGQEGTSARQHAENIPWTHGPTEDDYNVSSTPTMHRQVFTEDGNFDASQVPENAAGEAWVLVKLQAGGGGGASRSSAGAAPGGGGGEYVEKLINVAGETTIAVGVGAGGTGGATGGNNNGSDGEDTTFGGFLTAEKGKGGVQGSGGDNGNGGDGDLSVPGQFGWTGVAFTDVNDIDHVSTGPGGDSFLGIGGISIHTLGDQAGTDANGYGGGGAGAGTTSGADRAGGDGAPGIAIIEWIS